MSNPQLFCFTYAGGSASFFDIIEKDLPDIELVKPEYSGHGTRHREPLCKSFDELTDDIYDKFKELYKGGEYAFFGYSMGTITLVEILKRIEADSEIKAPFHLFLAAHEPHSKMELIGYSDKKPDDWVKERTIRFGAVPDKLKNNKSFWRVYLPLYKADYSIIRNYKFENLNLCSKIPATVFYSEADTPRTEMELWKRYFAGDCDFYQYEGNHFFIREHHVEMAKVIIEKMQKEGEVDDI